MIVFPLKWLPWILAIGGFIALITTGESFAIVPTLIGVVWLVYIFKGKNAGVNNSGTPQSSLNSTPAYKPITKTDSNTTNTASSANVSICPNCKAPIGEGMSFCMKCGTKVK